MGNNFNQVVRLFHTHFTPSAAASRLKVLERDMARLTGIVRQALSLAERYEAEKLAAGNPPEEKDGSPEQ